MNLRELEKVPAHQTSHLRTNKKRWHQRTSPFRAHQQCFSTPTHFPRTNPFYAYHPFLLSISPSKRRGGGVGARKMRWCAEI